MLCEIQLSTTTSEHQVLVEFNSNTLPNGCRSHFVKERHREGLRAYRPVQGQVATEVGLSRKALW